MAGDGAFPLRSAWLLKVRQRGGAAILNDATSFGDSDQTGGQIVTDWLLGGISSYLLDAVVPSPLGAPAGTFSQHYACVAAVPSPLGIPTAEFFATDLSVDMSGTVPSPLGAPASEFLDAWPSWSAALSSGPSRILKAHWAVYDIGWSAAITSPSSVFEADAWAGSLEMPSLGIGYAAQGAERSAVSAVTITCEIGGIAYPAQYLTIRKRLAAGDGTASYGSETADVAIPYTRVVFSALLAASRAGESIILSARYVLDSGEAYVRPMGDFALTSVKRSANGATVIASGERFPVYAVSDDPVLLAGSCYETARSVRCAVDHQVYPGQAVQGMAAAFTCDAVTITLDAPQASAIMEVFARG